VSAPFRFPKFFVTNPSPCPYLSGKVERKVFTELNGRNAAELNEALGASAFAALSPWPIGPAAWIVPNASRSRGFRRIHANATQRKLIRRHSISKSTPAGLGHLTNNMRCSATICRPATPAAEWPKWTSRIMRTWSSRHRSAPMSSNIASLRWTVSPASSSVPASVISRATASA
jgi:hypothetical protein